MIKKITPLHYLIVFLLITFLLVGCNPSFSTPTLPQLSTDEADSLDTLDPFGCFPVGCDLPPGMKELCEDYQAGTISWPADCAEMPGEGCQKLCESEKAAVGLDLPMTVVDGYQLGWMKPLQLDDNLGDVSRSDFSWAYNTPVVDNEGKVLLIYSALDEGKPSFYRFWDGEHLTDPQPWEGPQGVQSRVYDSQNLLHIISVENKDDPDQYLAHSIWDGETFISQQDIFRAQLIQPEFLSDNLVIDEQDHLHLVFYEKSQGVWEVMYSIFDGNVWSDPINLSHNVMGSVGPTIDIGDDGRLFVIWHEGTPDSPVETTVSHTLFTVFEDGEWTEPTPGGLGVVKVDSKGIVHSLSENLYTFWDGNVWSDPVMIDYHGQATAMYHYIIDPQDNIVFVWNRYNTLEEPTAEGYSMTRELMSRVKYADGSWSPVISLGVWDTTPSYNEVHTILAVDGAGVIHAATSGNFEGGLRQYYFNTGAPVIDESLAHLEVMPPQSAWSPYPSTEPDPATVVSAEGWHELQPFGFSSPYPLQLDFQIDNLGNLHAVWRGLDGADYEIFYSSYDGSSWLDPLNISNRMGYDYDPKLTMDESGALFAGWVGSVPGTTAAFSAKNDGTAWSDPLRLSEKITWRMTSALIDLTISKENVTRPSLAAGREGQVVMGWEHISDGVSNTIACVLRDSGGWEREQIPLEETHFPYAGERVAMDFDPAGNLHLVFTYSGTMEGFDEGIYLKAQLVHTFYDGSNWSDPVMLFPIDPDANPYDNMAFQSAVAAHSSDMIIVVFSMRPFDRHFSPYRIDNEDSNAYFVYWDGVDWSQPQRLDDGTAFGPSFVDIAKGPDDKTYVAWSKYDTYSKHYSVYSTSLSAGTKGEVVKIWESNIEQEPFPILRPVISVNDAGVVVIAFEYEDDGIWTGLFTMGE